MCVQFGRTKIVRPLIGVDMQPLIAVHVQPLLDDWHCIMLQYVQYHKCRINFGLLPPSCAAVCFERVQGRMTDVNSLPASRIPSGSKRANPSQIQNRHLKSNSHPSSSQSRIQSPCKNGPPESQSASQSIGRKQQATEG